MHRYLIYPDSLNLFRASVETAGGAKLEAHQPSGIFAWVRLVDAWDSDMLIGNQKGGYEPLGVERWIAQLSEIDPGGELVVTPNFKAGEGKAADLGGKPLLRAGFYGTTDTGGKFGAVSKIAPYFEGIQVRKPL